MSFVIVVMTVPNKDEAVRIISTLLNERLIACANILNLVHSIFRWNGKIEEEKEVLVFMKSRRRFFEKLSERVAELHSYDVPEILALQIVEGSQSYLDWMESCLESVK